MRNDTGLKGTSSGSGSVSGFGSSSATAFGGAGNEAAALVCFSHLRWDFVWQRPQHLLSRFARRLPVYVVEEPVFVAGAGASDLHEREDGGVTIVTPLLPADGEPSWGFNPTTNPRIRALLTTRFAEHGLVDAGAAGVITWYYTPMAVGAAPTELDVVLTIFDAMDELANFKGAPQALRDREAALMRSADLVFTGGPSLYEARKARHPRVSCFPSGVEPAHFARAANGIARPEDLDARPRPILGFYGVIDERLDLGLLAAVAEARPDWTIAMVGPVIKIDEAELPRRSNIVYYGRQEYRDLPSYLACFDVAILPFARNEATRFLSPTKTLEYMAGEKPIVSTPIRDVVDLYGGVVEFGETAAEFVAAVERALAETPASRAQRLATGRCILAEHTWDAIADGMWALIGDELARPVTEDNALAFGPAAAPVAAPRRIVPSRALPPAGFAPLGANRFEVEALAATEAGDD